MHDTEYTITSASIFSQPAQRLLALTIVWHPDTARIGEQFLDSGAAPVEVGRFMPLFRRLDQGTAAPAAALGDRCVARAPLLLRRVVGGGGVGVELTPPDSRMHIECNGVPVTQPQQLSQAQIEDGVLLALGRAVLVCVHWMDTLPRANHIDGLLGVGGAAIKLRELVRQAAATELTVLLLGATGSGKEVMAQAIHAASRKARGPLVAVNMAGLNESLAAADLFGAVRGAYTGAQAARAGFFAEADGGTLFLDEIGDTPAVIQPMLLRVLETGEYRPLGAAANQRSTARLIAATDFDLDARHFNQPLLRRLEAFVIQVPALRQRREDIGLLIQHFLRQCGGPAELPFSLVTALCRYDWPGNVRQLSHVVRRICIAIAAGETPLFDELVRRQAAQPSAPRDEDGQAGERNGAQQPPQAFAPAPAMDASGDGGGGTAADSRRTRLADIGDDEVIAAMDECGWQIRGAADALGISRPSLYKLLAAHPQVRGVEAIPLEEIRAAHQANGGDVERCASALRTPSEALRRYLAIVLP